MPEKAESPAGGEKVGELFDPSKLHNHMVSLS